MELPFTQENHDGFLVRTFSKDVESDELKWHYDLENRKITILEGSGWEFQMDNGLPHKLMVGDTHLIPKGIYHRIKRGSTDLKVKIEFYEQ